MPRNDTGTTATTNPGMPLSDMIETLRQELQLAMARGADEAVAFDIDKVELELKVAIGTKGKAEGGVAFWVVKAGASVEGQHDTVHTFKLTLTPVARASGERTRISADVDRQKSPARR
jgi:Trypsin-co-occurring domain 2